MDTNGIQSSRIIKKLYSQRYLLLLLLPGILYFVIFKYVPMYGLMLAFKKYDPQAGILGSPWVGLRYFNEMFGTSYFWKVVMNTLRISFAKIATGFPAPIILALLLNELTSMKFKRVVQTISYLPHFLSWVIVAGLIFQLASPSYGLYGYICNLLGIKGKVILGNPGTFFNILLGSNIWKNVGYSSIIYLAAIAGINVEMYEAAVIDGAGRLKQCLYITLPSILPTIAMLFILGLGNILDGGFDQIFNLDNAMVRPSVDIIDTYVYRIGLVDYRYEFSTAVGMSKSLVAIVLVVSSNWLMGKLSNYTIF